MKKGWFNRIIIQPLIASITGFGMFWWYALFNWNIWACIFMALFTSALMSQILSRQMSGAKTS